MAKQPNAAVSVGDGVNEHVKPARLPQPRTWGPADRAGPLMDVEVAVEVTTVGSARVPSASPRAGLLLEPAAKTTTLSPRDGCSALPRGTSTSRNYCAPRMLVVLQPEARVLVLVMMDVTTMTEMIYRSNFSFVLAVDVAVLVRAPAVRRLMRVRSARRMEAAVLLLLPTMVRVRSARRMVMELVMVLPPSVASARMILARFALEKPGASWTRSYISTASKGEEAKTRGPTGGVTIAHCGRRATCQAGRSRPRRCRQRCQMRPTFAEGAPCLKSSPVAPRVTSCC